jgi:hypothetical protein
MHCLSIKTEFARLVLVLQWVEATTTFSGDPVMPKYQVELQNGKKYVVEADSMPTEDEVAAELQKNPKYMDTLSTPTDVQHLPASQSIPGIVAGMGKQTWDVIKSLPGAAYSAVTTNPIDTLSTMASGLIHEPGAIQEQFAKGTPEDVGRAMARTVMLLSPVKEAPKVISAGARSLAQTAPVRAARSSVASGLRTLSEESPNLNAAASATGMRGKVGMAQKVLGVVAKKIDPGPLRSVDRYMPNASAEPSTPPPNADVVPSQDAAVQAMVDRYMPNTSTGHPPAPMASHVQTPESLAAANANPNLLLPSGSTFPYPMHGAVSSGASLMRQEGSLGELERLMMEREAAAKAAAPSTSHPSTNRGLTTAATERLMNVHTPGWQDVSLEEPTPMSSHTPEPVKRPSEVSPIEAIAGTMKERYDQLAGMAIRTPAQELEFQALDKAMKASGASNKGYAYATQGKRR